MFRRTLLTAVPLAAVAVVAVTFTSAEAVVAPKAGGIVLKQNNPLILDSKLIPAPERDRLVTVPNRVDAINKLNKVQVVSRVDLVNKHNKVQVVHMQHKLDRIQRVQVANRVPVPVPTKSGVLQPQPSPLPRK